MDYRAGIERVFDHLEDDHVDKAAMACLRIARNRKDYLYAGAFLRLMYPPKHELVHVFGEDTAELKYEERNFFWKSSFKYWADLHTLDFSFCTGADGEEKNMLVMGVFEIDHELSQWDKSIEDLQLPQGMTPFDTAAFHHQQETRKAEIRLRIKALHTVRSRIRAFCLNYAIRVEKELQAQDKSQQFLARTQNEVNNYFKAKSDDVYTKLIKAAQLVDSLDDEDFSLLLTEVRRAMKASADFFYPPVDQEVQCADGKMRVMNDEKYINRLHEFVVTTFRKSSAKDLIVSEFEYLSVFAKRLNDVASKGVHADVTAEEAKQGLLGLYMFLYNVIARLQRDVE